MAWIELHQALFTHRKTVEAAEILDLPEVYVVGHLAAIWSWALDNAPDGRIKTRPRLVERVAQWPGESGKLLAALIEVEFMEKDGDDLIIHDWMDYAGRLIDKRQKNTQRMRGARAKTTNEQPDDVQDTCDARVLHVQGLPYPTVPNRTQPYPTVPENDAQPATAGPYQPEGTVHKPGKIDLKLILAERPHWVLWLQANRPAPRPGKTAVGFDRWKVCQWLNGEEDPPPMPPPPPTVKPLPVYFAGKFGGLSDDAAWLYIRQTLGRLTTQGKLSIGDWKADPARHADLVIAAARHFYNLDIPAVAAPGGTEAPGLDGPPIVPRSMPVEAVL